jgi:hypothetical protein
MLPSVSVHGVCPKRLLRLGHLRDFGRDKAVKRETTLSRNERHRIGPEGAK